MSEFTVTLPSGAVWTPKFVQSIDQKKCIGCGRCYKVCPQRVMSLIGLDEHGDVVDIGDEDEDEIERKVMTLVHQDKCIGCTACSRVCPKNCYTHAALSI